MSARSKKGTASGYNAASAHQTPKEFQNLGRATATLILTPKLIHRIGAAFRMEFRVESGLLSISDLYQEALKKSLLPVTKSKSVPDFEGRVRNGLLFYSKYYDGILYECERILGASRFKLEYVKQIAELYKEFRDLPFASLDIIELFRRHVVCCKNAAAAYEELFENSSHKLYTVDLLLRTTNYGLTVLVLLLDGTLTGSLWIMAELQRLTSDALREMESMPEIRKNTGQLSGSLVFTEGDLDLKPDTGKPR